MKESGEMYLESIYVLCKTSSKVRSVDVAEHMNYSKPSVCRGVGLLKNAGYILVDQEGYITLTEVGLQTAEKIFERHTVLKNLLVFIGVDEKTATEDACKMEHIISDKSFDAMKNHMLLHTDK